MINVELEEAEMSSLIVLQAKDPTSSVIRNPWPQKTQGKKTFLSFPACGSLGHSLASGEVSLTFPFISS